MKQWISDYIQAHKAALDSIPAAAVAGLIERLRQALLQNRHIFVFGNGGSAANASHFVTDLGKSSSTPVDNQVVTKPESTPEELLQQIARLQEELTRR